MRMHQTCVYIMASSVLLFHGLAYADPSMKSQQTQQQKQQQTSSGNRGNESYSPPSGAKAGRDATLPDPTTNRKGASGRSGSGSGSMGSSGTGSAGGSGGGS